MKIDSSFQSFQPPPSEITAARNAGHPTSSTSAANTSAIVGHGDATHWSSAALEALASSALPEVRAEKVAAIQQALASGTYAVSPSDVADKLIDHMLQG